MQRLTRQKCIHLPYVRLAPPVARTATLRHYASTRSRTQIKTGYLFSVLALVGLGATSYGLFLFYSSFKTWPASVRGPLRSAIRAKEFKDIKNAELFFRKALEEAKALPAEELGHNASLKITGIFIALAGMLENEGREGEALAEYEAALDDLPPYADSSLEEKQRRIALAQKIGQLAQSIGGAAMLAKAEDQLAWSVTQLLKLSSSPDQRAAAQARTEKGDVGLHMQDLDLPTWAERTNLGASMENLGSFYLSQGNPDYAATLFTQALNVLLPAATPEQSQVSFSDRCHGSTLANNICSAFVANPTSANLEKAERWAANAIHMARHTLQDAEKVGKADDALECGTCLAVGLYNAGMLKEMQGKREEATKLLRQGLSQSRSIRFIQGSQQCLAALDRLKSTQDA